MGGGLEQRALEYKKCRFGKEGRKNLSAPPYPSSRLFLPRFSGAKFSGKMGRVQARNRLTVKWERRGAKKRKELARCVRESRGERKKMVDPGPGLI